MSLPKFLRQIARERPKDKPLHLIAGNYAKHKHQVVQDWRAPHPRFNMQFTPTSASWLNMVERIAEIRHRAHPQQRARLVSEM